MRKTICALSKRRANLAALLLATVAPSNAVGQTVTATWLSAQNGAWADPTQWSSNPDFPNNGTPAGTTYDAEIEATGTPYTVSLAQNIEVNNLTLGNGATLQLNSFHATLTLDQTMTLLDGSNFMLNGSTVNGGTINGNGNVVDSETTGTPATLNNVILNTQLEIPDDSQISFTGTTQLGSNGVVQLDGQQNDLILGTLLTGQGQIIFNRSPSGGAGLGNINLSNSGTTCTFDTGITLTTGTGSGEFINSSLINKGTILAQNDQTLILHVVDNQGAMHASTGGVLAVPTNLTNEGSITADGGTLEMQLPFTPQPGTFYVHNGRFQFVGAATVAAVDALDIKNSVIAIGLGGFVNNSGETLNVVDGTNTWHLAGGINGGTVSAPPGVPLEVEAVPNNFTAGITSDLSGVQVTTGLNLDAGANLTLSDGTSISGQTIQMIGGKLFPNGQPTSLSFDSTVSMSNNTTVLFAGGVDNNLVSAAAIPNGATVTTGTGGGTISAGDGSLTLSGNVSAVTPGDEVTLSATSIMNHGVMTVSADSLQVPMILSEAANGIVPVPLTSDGTVDLDAGGILNIAGSFSQLSAGTADFELDGAGSGQFGELITTGNIHLAGELLVELAPGYQAKIGDHFPIITTSSGNISGAFTNEVFETGGEQFLISYNTTNVTLTALPEPSGVFLLVTLAGVLSAFRPRIYGR